MRQIALKKRFGGWLGRRPPLPGVQDFDPCSGVEWWRRLFLPADFGSNAVLCHEESLECKKLVTEYLSVKESHRIATVTVGEAQKYRRDLNYPPLDFRNRRITTIQDEQKLQCSRCKGKGKLDCSPDVPCPSCKGRRIRNDFCFACGGSGRSGMDQKEQCWSCGGRGTRSEDCAACAGVYSGSTGRVRCQRCGGAGWVVCRTCVGAGERIRARLTTRHYTPSHEVHYRLGSLHTDRFKNGLTQKHFGALPGKLSFQEFQLPSCETVAMQRLTAFSYAVESRTYRYMGADFLVNRISANEGVKFVTRGLPWSTPRLAVAGIGSVLAICFLAATFLVL